MNILPSKKKYIIWAMPWTRSCGTQVMYTLYSRLRSKGYETFIFCPEEHRPEYNYVDIITDNMRLNDLVVYPEIVYGNPLRFQNVVRYVLYFPGALAGEKTYHPSESIFTWTENYYPAPELYWCTIDKTLFCDEHLPKTQNCYFINKLGKWREVEEIGDAVEINMDFPATKSELAKLLKTTHTLYSFDRYTMLNDEAILCGAKVKIVTENGLEDFQSFSLVDESQTDRQLKRFIAITQAMDYSGELQEEESFFPYYVGIFYRAGARCAACGAWSDALAWCRKAYMGKPLTPPALILPDAIPSDEEQQAPSTVLPSPLKNSLRLFLSHAAAGEYTLAETHLRPLITFQVEQHNLLAASALLVSLALLFAQAGKNEKATETMSQALKFNPFNPIAVHWQVLKCLDQGKFNQALFLACSLLMPFLHPLNIEKVFPGLGLLGLIASQHPDKMDDMAHHIPFMLDRVKTTSSLRNRDQM